MKDRAMHLDCIIRRAASVIQTKGTVLYAARRTQLFCTSRIGIVLVLAFFVRISAFAATPDHECHILFVTSVDPDEPGIAALIEETRIEIQGVIERPTHFDIEYLDPELSDANPTANAITVGYLRDKYSHQRFELIITIGPGALRFAEDHSGQLFPAAKIISMLLNSSPGNTEPVSSAAVTTVYVAPDFAPTVETVLAQNPGTQQLVLIAGSSANDKSQLEWVKENLAIYASRLQFLDLTNNTLDQLKQKLSRLGPNSVVLFVDFDSDSTGGQYVSTRVLRDLSQSANRPIYGTLLEQIGSGAVGGNVIDMREAGRVMGKTATQVLNGGKTENVLALGRKQQRYIFDARQLRRWHISQLPAGSQVLNQEPVWWLHDGRFIALALAVFLETLLIGFLVKTTLRRMRVERYLARLLLVVRLESGLATNIINLALGLARTEISQGFNEFSEVIGIDCISIYEFQQETAQFHLLGYSSVQGTRLRLSQLKPSEFKQTADKLLRGQPVMVRTVADMPRESLQITQELRKSGLHSFAGIPIFVDKRVVGVLFFSSSREPDWDETLLGELHLVADMVGSGLDRARVHASLTRSEQLKSAILASLPAFVVVLDRDGRVIDFNCSTKATSFECDFGETSLSLGVDYRELYRKAAGQGSSHAQTALNGLQSVLSREATNFEVEYPCGVAPGEYWSRMHVVPLSGEQGGVVVTHSDVTERKLAELEREQLETARGELGGRLLRAQEEERARVARELHDDINQKLGLLAVDIQTLQQNAPETREEMHCELQGLFRTTNRISADIQRISYQLHSFRLDYLGLAAAVRRLCSEFTEKHDIAVECFIENVPGRLSREIGLCLFRVVQECLTNIAKHSSATRVAVRLRYLEETMCMSVADNGTGFNLGMKGVRNEPGLGLISMRERLRLINGDLAVHSEQGAGTEITATVPVNEERPAENTNPRVERKFV